MLFMLRGRRLRGLSEVTAAALLAMIVLAVGTAVYFAVGGMANVYGNLYRQEIDRSIAQQNLRLSIEYIHVKPNGTCILFIRNYGREDALITDAYIYPANSSVNVGLSFNLSIPIRRGELGKVALTCGDCVDADEVIAKIYAIPSRLHSSTSPSSEYAQFGRWFSIRTVVAHI